MQDIRASAAPPVFIRVAQPNLCVHSAQIMRDSGRDRHQAARIAGLCVINRLDRLTGAGRKNTYSRISIFSAAIKNTFSCSYCKKPGPMRFRFFVYKRDICFAAAEQQKLEVKLLLIRRFIRMILLLLCSSKQPVHRNL